MLPRELQPEQFGAYPSQARALAVAHIVALRQLPIGFLPSLLREIIEYDFKFPIERSAIEKELANLNTLTSEQMHNWFHAFAELAVPSKLEQFDWINQPAQFTEQLSAHLWSTHQLDKFRKAATDYGDRLLLISPPEPPPIRRVGIAIIGQGVSSHDGALFRNLRDHGTYFTQVKPENGVQILIEAAALRARAHPAPFAHWYVDGGQPFNPSLPLTCISYKEMEPMRNALLKNMQTRIEQPGMGPEELRTHMVRLVPSDLGINTAGDPVRVHFQLKLLTEGSGTQIFSTTFVQWATREILRRAQALTLVVRYSPRQRQKPMNELLSSKHENPELDPIGSLIDADMSAYYHWINQQRLPGESESSFLVWFEGHNQALVAAPTLPRGTSSNSPLDLDQLLKLAIS